MQQDGCECWKAKIKCSLIFANFKGSSCTNSVQAEEIEEPDDDGNLDFKDTSDKAMDSVLESKN